MDVFSLDEVKHIAKLANLDLTPDEIKKYQKQLGETLKYINILNKIDTKNVPPTNQTNKLSNISRVDIPSDSLESEKVLAQASKSYNDFFEVKGILKKE